MKITKQIAEHYRSIHFGGNWTVSSMKEHLTDVDWEQATTQLPNLNTIVGLVYHMHYYVIGVAKALKGKPMETKDKYSFDHPPIQSQEDWVNFLDSIYSEAENFAQLIEKIPDEQLWETFVERKYGTLYFNLHGIIEHHHYHLGQIVLIKKMVKENK